VVSATRRAVTKGSGPPLSYARRNRPRFLAELREFLRFPTVSSDANRARDLKNCAAWLRDHLRNIGLKDVQLIPTPSHPIVYAGWRHAAGRPTILIYGHYDVVPPDPIREWRTEPFEPTMVGDDLYARGASDDKGQLFTHLKALESYLATCGRLPVNIKCIIEGEEEIGSPNLLRFIARNKAPLRASAAVISDTHMLGPGRPALSYSERGSLKLEWEVRGPTEELHSGTFGGAIHNPLQALCEMIAKLHDSRGRVAIPGFYEHVRRSSDAERAYMARTGPPDAQILDAAGTRTGWGERGYSLYERTTTRPALTLNGLSGGHQGSGVKAIIPSRARVKLSFRLVPEQDPREVDRLFRKHVARLTPPGLHSKIRTLSSAKPVVMDRNHPVLKVASVACRRAFGSTPALVRSGGSIPVASALQEVLGIPTVLMGFGLPDDRIHAPNEKFHLPNFYNGIEASIWFLAAAGAKL
jgi:acetylornithine deacetylase/succinyl-diaminopimelate desuccinylase-like protein